MNIEKTIKKFPVLGSSLWHFYSRFINKNSFRGSASYWDDRYAVGGQSGAGSYGKLARFKANILNDFVQSNNIEKIIELGCGDGNQLSLSNYSSYVGFDISSQVIDICKERFKSDHNKTFYLMSEGADEKSDLTLSLDVIYHLIEDDVFNDYMIRLFDSSCKYVIIYSSNKDAPGLSLHVRHRMFSQWISKNREQWVLINKIENKYPLRRLLNRGSFADFYIYEKK